MGLEAESRREMEVTDLRAANARLLRELERVKQSKADIIEAVEQAVRDAISAIVLPPIPPPPKDRRRKGHEVAIAIASDWQLGKRTPSYNTDVCRERVMRYAEKVVDLTNLHRSHHPVPECHVWLLGDLVEGELIFPGQAHRIDASLFRQVLTVGPSILGAFLQTLLGSFDKVVVIGVIGNHGAIGGPVRRDYHPETNADMMMYEATRLLLGDEPRIEWRLPRPDGERAWYAIDKIGSLSALLVHGDQIRGGFAGYPWYGVGRRVRGWALGGVPEPFQLVAMGHWHRTVLLTEGPLRIYQSGSPESDNTWAAEQLGHTSLPEQWLLFADPEKGRITAEYIVDLR